MTRTGYVRISHKVGLKICVQLGAKIPKHFVQSRKKFCQTQAHTHAHAHTHTHTHTRTQATPWDWLLFSFFLSSTTQLKLHHHRSVRIVAKKMGGATLGHAAPDELSRAPPVNPSQGQPFYRLVAINSL